MQYLVFIASLLISILILKVNITKLYEFDDILINTKLGSVKGSLMKSRLRKIIYAFRGLYYAEAPIAELRFKDPVPIKPWSGTFDATQDGPACPQEKGINISENCLILNIYTKILPNDYEKFDDKLPVIVYLHPGSFYLGSSQSFQFGPKYLLDHDIVLVTLNYRLGSLGFINTGDVYSTGNYGFKDQVLALKFVQDHIAPFGGDPRSVTLTGQSAGSRSILLHMVSPMSEGLFHRAIGLSGSMTTPIPAQREQTAQAIKQAKLLNCSVESREEMFKCLKQRPFTEFGRTAPMMADWYFNPMIRWYPSIEPDIPGVEKFLNDELETLIKQGKMRPIPIIFGITKDEISYVVTKPILDAKAGNDSFFQELTNNWYELAPICFQYERGSYRSRLISQEILKYYFNNKPITLENADILQKLYANSYNHFPSYRAANLISQYSSAPIYFYEFSYQSRYSMQMFLDGKFKGGVAHGDDLIYLFNMENNNSNSFPLFTERDPEILKVKQMTAIWAHFAKTGEPLPSDYKLFGNVIWKRYIPHKKHYLEIGKDLIVKKNYLGDTMRFWNSLFH